MDKPVEIQPLIPRFHDPNGTTAALGPDRADDGKKPNPVFIEAPQLHHAGGIGGFDLGDELRKRFF
jgi:hypothetical protein